MARIRSIKPEVRKSRTVTGWPRDVRLTWIYLWGYLDDEGRGEDDLALIKAECFPRDRDVTESKLDGWLWTIVEKRPDLEKAAPLCRYRVNGQDYLHAVNWGEHQKISHKKDSAIPPCHYHELREAGEIRARDGIHLIEFRSASGMSPDWLS